ncbi:MAG TPA: sulfotransferase [Terriglobales bacterium]|nr:sulfotransferase [Terriglobales bacterium]
MGGSGALGELGGKPSNSIDRILSLAANRKARRLAASVAKGCERAIPSFFIIGPPRTGTTWLYEILNPHAVLPRSSKETRFFDTHFHRGLSWYLAHYPRVVDDRPVGEIAPTYFASPQARERLAQTVPDAKVVCTFRNPVDRVLSLYRLKRAYGLIPWSFEHALTRDAELIESSRYATHLKAWQSTFGVSQVLTTIYDDLCINTQAYLDKLVDFVGVPRFTLNPTQTVVVHTSESMTHPRSYYRTRSAMFMVEWFRARRLNGLVRAVKKSPMCRFFLGGGPAFADLPLETTLKLYELFRPEVEQLEVMLNRDLSSWKSLNAPLAASQVAS